MALSRIAPIVTPATHGHTASLIFLHGYGGTGEALRDCLKAILGKELMFRHIRIVYPTSPLRPFTACGGVVDRAWFDMYEMTPFVPEHTKTLDDGCKTLRALINQEKLQGIPRSRVVLGGFSMGAILSCYYGYQFGRTLAGIFALSGTLNKDSAVYKTLRNNPRRTPPLYQSHGENDDVVRFEWGKEASVRLASLGVNTSFLSYPIAHEISRAEIDALTKWVTNTLPEA